MIGESIRDTASKLEQASEVLHMARPEGTGKHTESKSREMVVDNTGVYISLHEWWNSKGLTRRVLRDNICGSTS